MEVSLYYHPSWMEKFFMYGSFIWNSITCRAEFCSCFNPAICTCSNWNRFNVLYVPDIFCRKLWLLYKTIIHLYFKMYQFSSCGGFNYWTKSYEFEHAACYRETTVSSWAWYRSQLTHLRSVMGPDRPQMPLMIRYLTILSPFPFFFVLYFINIFSFCSLSIEKKRLFAHVANVAA
jgi:hypothetical protein